MANVAIECKELSKRYVITHQERYVALRDRLAPKYLIDALLRRHASTTQEEFWALREVSFDVDMGQAVGIIGRNGAGKSTLLKVLSRITNPTSGEVRIHGRVASLLEVGTGFHPELTGRENIFLNGAILGMKRRDITRKFDAIVDFAGVERFIDTPVKRYSSGMYVRLAFAVAAHLEPEILIVDEVLAVGDADFQKKCLGKMQDVANSDGRTILFVSHNLTAIQSLCKRSVWLDKGKIAEFGESAAVVSAYLSRGARPQLAREWSGADAHAGNEKVRLRSARLEPEDGATTVDVATAFSLVFEIENLVDAHPLNVSISVDTLAGDCVFNVGGARGDWDRGVHRVTCAIPANLMNDNTYTVRLMVVVDQASVVLQVDEALTFEVHDGPREGGWFGKWPGAVRPTFLRWDRQPIALEEPVSNQARVVA